MHLEDFFNLPINLSLKNSLIQIGFWPLHVYHPQWVGIILLFDSLYLFITWLSVALVVLQRAITINFNDLSPDVTHEDDYKKVIKVIVMARRMVYIMTTLSSLQLVLYEPILGIVFMLIFYTSFMIWVLLKMALLENQTKPPLN